MKAWAAMLTLFLVPGASMAMAQDDKYVTREEYEKLKKDLEALKAKQGTPQDKDKKKDDQDLQQQIDDLEKELKSVKEKAEESKPGWTKFVLSGFAFAGFDALHGSKSSFNAGFNPVFLWEPTDRLFFEAQLELGLEGTETTLALEYATLSYVVSDYMTIGAGRFLTPFGTFNERLHQAWINKLPDKPFAFDDGGIAPEGTVGVEVRGAFALTDSSKMMYAVYAGNSPRLETQTTDAGILFDDNLTDLKDRKCAGARLGVLPFPELEIGYSVLFGRVGDSVAGFTDMGDMVMHGPDLGYVRDSDLLKGTVSVFGQWVWSSVSRITYDPTGGLGFGPANFANHRVGGFIQGSYRPSKIDTAVVKDLEVVLRYDVLNQPHQAPNATDDRRWTLGLDYWITPSAVLKIAYEWDKRSDPAGPVMDANGVLMQFAMGF
jgi:hypothetical protein